MAKTVGHKAVRRHGDNQHNLVAAHSEVSPKAKVAAGTVHPVADIILCTGTED